MAATEKYIVSAGASSPLGIRHMAAQNSAVNAAPNSTNGFRRPHRKRELSEITPITGSLTASKIFDPMRIMPITEALTPSPR